MKNVFKDKVVLITGGASGLGRLLTEAMWGFDVRHVVVWDVSAAGLAQLGTDFNDYAGQLTLIKVDLALPDQIFKAAEETREAIDQVDVIFNNAGIVVGKLFQDHNHADIQRSMAINSMALMHIVLEFLPGMLVRNSGSICNISSSAGLVANPKMSVYVASKWAVNGWSESLRLELKAQKKQISVTTIMPFYISTGMFEGVRSPLIPVLTPERAVAKILRAVMRRKSILSMPLPYWFIRLSQGLLPLNAFDWVMKNVFKIYQSMDEFKGRG